MKTLCADGSVPFGHARVGHCQALTEKPLRSKDFRAFLFSRYAFGASEFGGTSTCTDAREVRDHDDHRKAACSTQRECAIYAVEPEDPVLEAIRLMADRHVGALLVMKGDELAGIVSERDYARKVILLGRSSKRHARCGRS